MNMSAMSKGTPSAGFYVLRSMKKYPLRALALYGANRFMRSMATTVLGFARFSNFALFDSEAIARDWLERGDTAPATLAPECTPVAGRLRRLAVPIGVAASAALILRAALTRRVKDSSRTS
jgi:hypothetical protein